MNKIGDSIDAAKETASTWANTIKQGITDAFADFQITIEFSDGTFATLTTKTKEAIEKGSEEGAAALSKEMTDAIDKSASDNSANNFYEQEAENIAKHQEVLNK